MKNSEYELCSRYFSLSGAEEVWDRLTDVIAWPQVWRNIRSVEFSGGERLVSTGSVISCVIKSPLFYSVKITVEVIDVVPYRRLAFRCSGDLSGNGSWEISRSGSGLESVFRMNVSAGSFLLRTIQALPFGRRILLFSHRSIMDNGYRSFISADAVQSGIKFQGGSSDF